jgi:lipopolysaccharide/colanic/teichoic acid biosynthesis glycosyltransferase
VRTPSRSRRVFDVIGALGGLVFFAPILTVVMAAVLLDDGRPLLFRQVRLGRGRRPFEILKVRTMRDGRVTRAGRWLRATGLDELPQFLNILRGDLHVVGPRPVTAEDAERFGWLEARADARWSMAPGLTGVAQLAGGSTEDALRWDCWYVTRRRTLGLDCGVVAMSFVVNAVGKVRARRLLVRLGLVA